MKKLSVIVEAVLLTSVVIFGFASSAAYAGGGGGDGGHQRGWDETTNALEMPWQPAVLPLKVIDDNTGLTLLIRSPIFKIAFEKELEGNNRLFMSMAANALTSGNGEALWNTYKDRFSSRAQFEQGLQQLNPMVTGLKEKPRAEVQIAYLPAEDMQGASNAQ